MERRWFLRGLLGLPAAVAAARALDEPEMTRGEEIARDHDDLAGHETRVATGESPSWGAAIPIHMGSEEVYAETTGRMKHGALAVGEEGRLRMAMPGDLAVATAVQHVRGSTWVVSTTQYPWRVEA